MRRILIVEDEKNMRDLLKTFLIKNNFDVLIACDGEEALNFFYENNFDLIILDVMLPKKDGWSLCREIKKNSSVSVIILTSRSEEDDEVFGFELGANDFIKKPFSLKVLLARVENILNNTNEKRVIKKDKISIDLDSRMVDIDGYTLSLTQKEYELLVYLIKYENIVVSREKLLNEVWGFNYFGDTRTVDTHIKMLRKKIKENYIQTIYGVGYKFKIGF